MNVFSVRESCNSPQTILLIDNQPLFRLGVRRALADSERWLLLDETASPKEGVQLAQALSPDLVLLGLKHMECLDVLQQIRRAAEYPAILAFLDTAHETFRRELLTAGASSCLPRKITEDEFALLLSELDDPAFLGQKRQECSNVEHPGERPAQWMERLTRQERKILAVLATGKCNKLIGRELGIAEGTVKVHLKNLYKKMNCQGRTHAINCFLSSTAPGRQFASRAGSPVAERSMVPG